MESLADHMTAGRLVIPVLATTAAALVVTQAALADVIRIGHYAQQAGPKHAVIGARIDATHRRSSDRGPRKAAATGAMVTVAKQSTGTVQTAPAAFPSLAANAKLLRNPHPLGPQSHWYGRGTGQPCIYLPGSSPTCFTLVAAARAAGGVAPVVVAASVARRLDLVTGRIGVSPAQAGLTGAASWFWLDPAPSSQTLSVSLAGERVSVTAEPSVEWRFGDGGVFTGGAGVEYEPGPPPPDAVTHVYGTRCLPGDQGHDPYVLASCGPDGYGVEALVTWRISYAASGPIAAGGALPARTTESSAVYPVSEARAFLASGGSG
jgi:hypothetical protein